MTARKTWTEVFVRDEEHVARIAGMLVHEGLEFDVRPEPDGWWRVRADDRAAASRLIGDQSGLHWMVQTTRMSA